MRKRVHRSTLRRLNKHGRLPIVGFEMDWLFFGGGCRGRWRWGNPRRLFGVKTRQEIRAEQEERLANG